MIMQLNFETPLDSLTAYLHRQGWIATSDRVTALEKPGEGNMNMVLRAVTEQGSIILKQANPFVQKYPSIPAPTERAKVEYLFYHLLQSTTAIQDFLPQLVGFDAVNHLIAVQDLGHSADFSFIYKKENTLHENTLLEITSFLSLLHNITFDQTTTSQFPSNLALRTLNHQHLFVYPFLENNGFDLDTVQMGLQALSLQFKTNSVLKTSLQALGELYLSVGTTLLHGDYYPGSWLKSATGFKVIDPEFCYFGNAAYDIGILIAHLKMAQLPSSSIDLVFSHYKKPKGFDQHLALQFAGVEMLRRMIGLAQLPLDLTLEEKAKLLAEAKDMVLS